MVLRQQEEGLLHQLTVTLVFLVIDFIRMPTPLQKLGLRPRTFYRRSNHVLEMNSMSIEWCGGNYGSVHTKV